MISIPLLSDKFHAGPGGNWGVFAVLAVSMIPPKQHPPQFSYFIEINVLFCLTPVMGYATIFMCEIQILRLAKSGRSEEKENQ